MGANQSKGKPARAGTANVAMTNGSGPSPVPAGATGRRASASNRVAAEPSSPGAAGKSALVVAGRSPNQLSSLVELPDELLLPILAMLSANDLCAILLACKRLYAIGVDDVLWQPFVLSSYHPVPSAPAADSPIQGLRKRIKYLTLGKIEGPPVPTQDFRNFMIVLNRSRCLRCGISCPDPGTALGRRCLRLRGQRFCQDCQDVLFIAETTAAAVFCLPPQMLLNSTALHPIKVYEVNYFLRKELGALSESYWGGREKLEAEQERRKREWQRAHDSLVQGVMRGPGGRIVLR
ncbi:hypothetical protein DFJ74DRAFT_679510 [Hyaloraphidium curvatum]|nr:hypothetical protein DFJ74DRAFT_679510 [Hyaloraphidium curvatum]